MTMGPAPNSQACPMTMGPACADDHDRLDVCAFGHADHFHGDNVDLGCAFNDPGPAQLGYRSDSPGLPKVVVGVVMDFAEQSEAGNRQAASQFADCYKLLVSGGPDLANEGMIAQFGRLPGQRRRRRIAIVGNGKIE
jgi:hypothetical protein